MGALDYLGAVTPATRQIAAEVVAHLNRVGKPLPVYPDMGSQVIWGYNAGGAEHGTGRALDFMVQRPGPVGEEIVSYVWQHRQRLDLQHIIWRQRIRSTKTQPGVWRGMADRGSPTENHMDHPHILFGVNARSSGNPASGGGGGGGSTDIALGKFSVKQIQELVGVKVDGIAGPATIKAVKELQAALGLTADGLVGPATEGEIMALQDDIKGIARDQKRIMTLLRSMPKSVWAHQIPTPKSVSSTFKSANKKYTAGGLLSYSTIDFFTEGRSAKTLEVVNDIDKQLRDDQ